MFNVKLTLKRKVGALATLAAVLPVLTIFFLVSRFQTAVSRTAATELGSLAMANIAQIAIDKALLSMSESIGGMFLPVKGYFAS